MEVSGAGSSSIQRSSVVVRDLSFPAEFEGVVVREEIKSYVDAQKSQKESHEKIAASVTRLETAYGNLAKAHANLQSDFKKEKERNNKKSKFMIKMWRGIKFIFKWGNPRKKIPVGDKNDSEEYSFMSEAVGDDDDDEATSSAQH